MSFEYVTVAGFSDEENEKLAEWVPREKLKAIVDSQVKKRMLDELAGIIKVSESRWVNGECKEVAEYRSGVYIANQIEIDKEINSILAEMADYEEKTGDPQIAKIYEKLVELFFGGRFKESKVRGKENEL